ncbi:hypothetical protein PTSG_08293 [Salpingoeca rosetta]|uniref:PH domain-containing protein n=1 Tax=Salpingoeca rosetta (strain ATCC 50818 / BSB-021) TaxID=946362 RepID=F2UJA2_SALR5|nr:uncharacterized protein PTSG_08293 [Salpingoeca rosetta]EGD77201.1 hypothetical protein PTSG_08293 [Salpingoeca rosetta]|eukprot:XP_004990545.1 hypothetical protein PTSG_08293 [Salpingoeca rosetta]
MSEHEVHSGYLIKSPPLNTLLDVSFKRWKRRKFTLTDRAFAYDTGKGVKEIPLSHMTAINRCSGGKYDFMFSISTTLKNNRVYFFSADSAQSRDLWIKHLTEQTGLKCGSTSDPSVDQPATSSSTDYFKKRISVTYGEAPFELEVQQYAIMLFPKGSKEVYKSFQLKHLRQYAQQDRIFKLEAGSQCPYGAGWTSVTLPPGVCIVPAVNHASQLTRESMRTQSASSISTTTSSSSSITVPPPRKFVVHEEESDGIERGVDGRPKMNYVDLDLVGSATTRKTATATAATTEHRHDSSASDSSSVASTHDDYNKHDSASPTPATATTSEGDTRPPSMPVANADNNTTEETSTSPQPPASSSPSPPTTTAAGDGNNTTATTMVNEAYVSSDVLDGAVGVSAYSTLDWDKMEALRIATEMHSPVKRSTAPPPTPAATKERAAMAVPEETKNSSSDKLLQDIDSLLDGLDE